VNDTAPEGYTVPSARLIARLDGVIDRGDSKWYARCPAHEDRSPSLSIHDTGERILIHCFADCATEGVLAAVGLTFRDLYSDPWRASYAAATANPGRKSTDRMLRNADPLDIERMVLQIAAVDLRAGKTLSTEDRARVELARQRLETAGSVAA